MKSTSQKGKRAQRLVGAKRLEETLQQRNAAEDELRRHAAEWVAVIRVRITALALEVQRVNAKCQEGSLLARVINPRRLSEVAVGLSDTDSAASGLDIAGVDMPIPDLLGMQQYLTTKLFPLAAEGGGE